MRQTSFVLYAAATPRKAGHPAQSSLYCPRNWFPRTPPKVPHPRTPSPRYLLLTYLLPTAVGGRRDRDYAPRTFPHYHNHTSSPGCSLRRALSAWWELPPRNSAIHPIRHMPRAEPEPRRNPPANVDAAGAGRRAIHTMSPGTYPPAHDPPIRPSDPARWQGPGCRLAGNRAPSCDAHYVPGNYPATQNQHVPNPA